MIRTDDVMNEKREVYRNYVKSVVKPDRRIKIVEHNKRARSGNEIAIEINDILNKYDISLKVFVYFIEHPEIKEFNTHCPVCGNKIDLIERFKTTCSKDCSYKNPEMKERRKRTCLEKYGVEYTGQSEIIKQHIKESNIKKYGVEYSWQAESVKNKIKKKMVERYGVTSPLKSEKIKEKVKNTLMEKHGVTHQMYIQEVKDKIKATNLEKYGVENPFQSETFKEKIKATNLEKYGVQYPSQSEEIRRKRVETYIKHYGVDHPFKNKEINKKHRDIYVANYRRSHYENFKKSSEISNLEILTPYEEHLTAELIKYKCKKCNCIFEGIYSAAIDSKQKVYCSDCAKRALSVEEANIYNFVCDLVGNDNVLRNVRDVLDGGRELDIYIPSKNLAIEYNGIYWHSTEFKDKTYHIKKTLECKERGIRLIHIFENDWLKKGEIVKSIISSALGIYKEKIYARKCEVKLLKNKDCISFLNENHIQGHYNSTINYGLFYNDEMVSCIGLGSSRYKLDEYELIRFCNKLNTRVIGSLSKLIRHSGIKKLISYVNLSYFDGSGYEKVGFKLIRKNRPGYFYVENNGSFKSLSRNQCQKHKLNELLGDMFDPELTETENMISNGYLKIYDCGNLKYKLDLE